ncbi:MAG: hypothetical protein QW461_10785 [Candidatus Jordarchaeales archaeon]
MSKGGEEGRELDEIAKKISERVSEKVLGTLFNEFKELKDRLKAVEEASRASADQFDIEKFVEHTLDCEACRQRLENALSKYYKVKEVGRKKRS